MVCVGNISINSIFKNFFVLKIRSGMNIWVKKKLCYVSIISIFFSLDLRVCIFFYKFYFC